eukprot:TRINITY_DN57852_c0_g1_i1.p1 TRINITY_DN57852_c0_g1~~TRINITY_DN57852_c0_g1_i1.p1  ORF type:complete len:955 (+),score=247.66 TRINITY_DN57852_c0_g1_i1:128-2992(+)
MMGEDSSLMSDAWGDGSIIEVLPDELIDLTALMGNGGDSRQQSPTAAAAARGSQQQQRAHLGSVVEGADEGPASEGCDENWGRGPAPSGSGMTNSFDKSKARSAAAPAASSRRSESSVDYSSYCSNSGKDMPCNEEILEYLDRHGFRAFLSEVAVFVARQQPPDPFDFLLAHIRQLVARHRDSSFRSSDVEAFCNGSRSQTSAAPPPPPPTQLVARQREQVVRHVVAILQSNDVIRASATKLCKEFGTAESGADGGRTERKPSLSEEGFKRLLGHLQKTWGLQPEDGDHTSMVLKRWRFRTNAARGTRGMPLWPLSLEDWVAAYPAILRSLRDRYLPYSGHLHRSLFVRKATGALKDKYDRGPLLGRGAFGEVHLVTLKATKEKRVCKSVDRRFQKMPSEEVASEVDLLRALDHPHIIRVFEFFEDDDYLQMIMEPVFGGTLTNLVNAVYDGVGHDPHPDFEEGWVATVYLQLLSALSYAHGVAGLIHKDLKTDNVLMVARPNLEAAQLLLEPVHAMLADFGIAEIVAMEAPTAAADSVGAGGAWEAGGRSRSSGMPYAVTTKPRNTRVGGTPAYMSPEMFKGSFTEKSDLWSLGVMLFQTLTGELPYRGSNLYVLGQAVCNPRRHPPWEKMAKHNWSPGARAFCKQLLSKEEASRPSAAEALKDMWLSRTARSQHVVGPSSLGQSKNGVTLQRPHLQSHLMKVARACITSQLNLSQLHHMNQRFKHYDISGDGRLCYAEMRHVLEDVGIVAGEDLELILESLDSNHNGIIEYSEFIAGCIDISCETMKEHLRLAFNIFDLDGSGAISLEELRHVLTRGPNCNVQGGQRLFQDNGLAVDLAATWWPEDLCSILPDGKTVEELMEELDLDKEGMIEYHEFERYLLVEHEKVGRSLLRRASTADLGRGLEKEKIPKALALQQSPPPKSAGAGCGGVLKHRGRRFLFQSPEKPPVCS